MATKRFKKVYIEISNVCNLQCTFCPEVRRGKTFMGPELFQKAARAVAPLADAVCFHLMGEPLVHPRFAEYAAFCGTLGLPVDITTNGVLLDDARMEALLHPAIRQVNFSLQSFGDNFPERDNAGYLEKIFRFSRLALERRPELYINYRLWNEGSAGAPEANGRMLESIGKGLGVDINPVWDVRWKKGVPLTGRVSLHMDSRFEWPHPHNPVRSERGFCHGLSSHIGILAEGTVVPCCLDKEGVISLGNCGAQPLEDVVDSPRATAIREGFRKGLLVEDLCRKCTFISRFDGKVPGRGIPASV
jgi:MoaA/NifB/PqqE/SkfB family radical SAM enzyme